MNHQVKEQDRLIQQDTAVIRWSEFGARVWSVLSWIWSTVIVGGLIIGAGIEYATSTGESEFQFDPRSWKQFEFMAAHPIQTVIVVFVGVGLSFLAYLGHRHEQRARRRASLDHGEALVQIATGVKELLLSNSYDRGQAVIATGDDSLPFTNHPDQPGPDVLLVQEWESSSRLGDLQQASERLVSSNAEDFTELEMSLWSRELSSDLQSAIDDRDCYWAIRWLTGKPLEDVNLVYQAESITDYYENRMPEPIRAALERVRENDPAEYARLSQEPSGVKVRLEGLDFDHGSYMTNIYLSPSRYLYYVAVQQRLESNDMSELRAQFMDNAINGLQRREYLALPSLFSVHMAVVSADGYALLRQRTEYTELFPSAWESGVGEFMHGPHYSAFPHFNRRKNPKLQLFLSQAIAEEIGHADDDPGNYRIHGFAIERQTLAPKLLAVYRSNEDIDTLLHSASLARDGARAVEAVELTPQGVTSAFKDPRYGSWGPTSKLSTMLALTCVATSHSDRQQLIDQVREHMRR